VSGESSDSEFCVLDKTVENSEVDGDRSLSQTGIESDGLCRELTLKHRAMALLRHIALNLVWFLIGISAPESAAAERGYLQTVGPPRLRFWPPTERPTVDPMLDVYLALSAPVPTNAQPEGIATATNPEAATAHPVAVTNAPASEPVPTTPTVVAPAPETSTATSAPPGSTIQGVMPQPQLFLQYFTPEYLPGTNGYGYGYGLPVSFLPPQPARTASSSATYQTIPPEKP
jgi:hypothetical protein